MLYNNGFGIEINFLTGRYVATCSTNRHNPEWPPHFARFFSALVANWAEVSEPDNSERLALEWIESQKPPNVKASTATYRKVVTHFVPVNDVEIVSGSRYQKRFEKLQLLIDSEMDFDERRSSKTERIRKEILKVRDVENQVLPIGNTNPASATFLLPDFRKKQPRMYPSVSPEVAQVCFVWDVPLPYKFHTVLDQLLSRVTRLGHSSSLVSCRLVEYIDDPDYIVGQGEYRFRTTFSGQLTELKRRYNRHQGNSPRWLPYSHTSYYKVNKHNDPKIVSRPNTFSDWIVFEILRPRDFTTISTVAVAKKMRAALFRYTENPIPEEVCGHDAGGRPTLLNHIAFLPLPYTGFDHADGRLMGVAISVPRTLSPPARKMLYRSIANWEDAVTEKGKTTLELSFEGRKKIRLKRIQGNSSMVSLKPSIYCKSSERWVTVTPIALPRHPGRLNSKRSAAVTKAWHLAKNSVNSACEHIGLPHPLSVEISYSPFVQGSYRIERFPPFIQRDSYGKPIRRQLIHASVTFENPIEGTVILGSGRFFGLGLMLPLTTR